MPRGVRRLGSSDPQGDTSSVLSAALRALAAGDMEPAQELLERAASADPNSVDAYLALGCLYRSRGEDRRAIRVHQGLLLRHDLDEEKRVAVLWELAKDFERCGSPRRAIACHEEVLAYDSRHVGALRSLVALLSREGDYDRAIAMNRRLARATGEDRSTVEADLLVSTAEAARQGGRHDLARKALRRALRRDAGSWRALLLLGTLESERGRPKPAFAAWRKAAIIGGVEAAAVHPRLESAFVSLNRGREYPQFIRRLLEQHPEDATLRLLLARALATRGEVESAVIELRRLMDADCGSIPARVMLGRLLLSEQRRTDALKEYSELLEVLEHAGDSSQGEAPL